MSRDKIAAFMIKLAKKSGQTNRRLVSEKHSPSRVEEQTHGFVPINQFQQENMVSTMNGLTIETDKSSRT